MVPTFQKSNLSKSPSCLYWGCRAVLVSPRRGISPNSSGLLPHQRWRESSKWRAEWLQTERREDPAACFCSSCSLLGICLHGTIFYSAPSCQKLFRASHHVERSVGSRVVTEQAVGLVNSGLQNQGAPSCHPPVPHASSPAFSLLRLGSPLASPFVS